MTVGAATLLRFGQGGIDKTFARTYQAVFQVIASRMEGPAQVQQAAGIPAYGGPYILGNDFDLWAFADSSSASPVEFNVQFDLGNGPENCTKWEVTITWSTNANPRNSTDPRGNPINDPPIIGGSFVGQTELAFRDKDGQPISTTAGERYEDLPTRLDDTDTLTIGVKTSTINLVQRAEAIGKVNQAPIWGLGPRQVQLTQWGWSIEYAGSLPFIQNNFSFLISRKKHPTSNVAKGPTSAVGFFTTRPNEGYSFLEDANDQETRKVAKDEEDQPFNRPIKLNQNGTKRTSVEMLWNVFAVEEEYDFNTIPGIPNPLPGPFA